MSLKEQLLKERYLLKDKDGNVVENEDGMYRRVAKAVAKAEEKYSNSVKEWEDKFYDLMKSGSFMPNSPCLMNAGRDNGMLLACFVLPIEDNIEGIFDSIKATALIQKAGGGTGFSFDELRPTGDTISSSGGQTSGPISFWKVFAETTKAIQQGAFRRGANMGMLSVDSCDILNFINAKQDITKFTNFNISVKLTDDFIDNIKNHPNKLHVVKNKRTGKTYYIPKNINTSNYTINDLVETSKDNSCFTVKDIWNIIVKNAWSTGEPGVCFIDKVNACNPTPKLGPIKSSNPCVTGDTLISTINGLVPIKDITESTKILGKDGNFHSIFKFFSTGKKLVYKIITKCGYELKATSDHKILTPIGWIELGKLKTFDEILIQNCEGSFSSDDNIGVKNSYNIKWSKELGQVMGWIVGDGCIYESNGHFSTNITFGGDKINEVCNLLYLFINKITECNPSKQIKDNGTIQIHYSSVFSEFMISLGVKASCKSDKKEVPFSIFTAPKEAVVGFLQGIFSSDGTISTNNKNNTNYIRLTSKSIKLLKQIQQLLCNFNIISRIYDRSRFPNKKFLYTTVSGETKTYENDGILYELQISKNMIPIYLNKIGFIGDRFKDKIQHLKNIKFYSTKFSDKIKSIDYIGEEEVFDITEPETNSFVANGIVVHNCGESMMLDYEACDLGSINLSKFIIDGEMNVEKLKECVQVAVRFLDNILDISSYPISQIESMVKTNRKIGLGVMGFADALLLCKVKYNTKKAVSCAETWMKIINDEAKAYSYQLAREKGAFTDWDCSIYKCARRNANVTIIAPTGSISIIAECSSGIEPIYQYAYERNVLDNKKFIEIHPLLKQLGKDQDWLSIKVKNKLLKGIHPKDIDEIPKDISSLMITAHEVDFEQHINIQAAFQKHTENAVSKTINLPNTATIEDVEKAYLLAYDLGCKGVTVYRDGCRDNQSIASIGIENKELEKRPDITEGRTYKYRTGCGSLYVTVNKNIKTGKIYEVFTALSKGGGCESQSQATCRVISASMRKGVSPEILVDQLKSIRCTSTLVAKKDNKDIKVLSCPDAIAKAIEQFLGDVVIDNKAEEIKGDLCPDCGCKLVNESGCRMCYNCGYTKCG
jgi:ribonucleoside-diphosphate reductase alpha chain